MASMRSFYLRLLATLVLATMLNSFAFGQQLKPVASPIEMHPDKRIAAGDDIIVFGTGGFSGVDYMVPSAGDEKGRGIPDGDSFHASSFAVAGKKIALTNNFEVTIFDTRTQSSFKIPVSQMRLATVPGQLHDKGHMHADGHYIICRSDNSTEDQRWIKVIDVSAVEPRLINFSQNPPLIRADFVTHVMVDAGLHRAVAATTEVFYIYDVQNPDEEPVEIGIPEGISDIPPQLSGDFVLFQDREAYPNTWLLNLTTQQATKLVHNPGAAVMKLCGNSLLYFVAANSNDSVGNGNRTVFGQVDEPGKLTTVPERQFINGRTANHGAVGYGATAAISDDDNLIFIGGLTSVGAGEYLQVNQDGAFRLLPDPLGKDQFGCYATDVSLSNRTLAFKTKGPDHRAAYVGYLLLK